MGLDKQVIQMVKMINFIKLVRLLVISLSLFLLAGNSYGYDIKPGTKVLLRMLVLEGYAPEEDRLIFQKMMLNKYRVKVEFKIDYVIGPEQFLESLRRRSHELLTPSHNIPKSLRWPLIKSRLLLPIQTENIPNFKKIIPSLQQTDFLTENGNVYAVPFLQGSYGLVYDSSLTEEPKSWKALWEPAAIGKYAVSSGYPEVNVYITALATGVDKSDVSNLDIVDTPAFRRNLASLANNAARVWHGVDTAEILSGLAYSTSWGFALADLNADGRPWKMADPIEGSPAWVNTWALAAHLKNSPDQLWVAEKWINFVISDVTQLSYMRRLGASPTNANVAKIATASETRDFHIGDTKHFDDLWFWPILSSKTQFAYDNMWREVFQ
jgi:ABC-type Fe3+ transport system substrate-binding protein